MEISDGRHYAKEPMSFIKGQGKIEDFKIAVSGFQANAAADYTFKVRQCKLGPQLESTYTSFQTLIAEKNII